MSSVYRLYDSDDALLYVGCSTNAEHRIEQHVDYGPWHTEIVRWTVEPFPSHAVALVAEADAIRTEQPRHNIVHKFPRADGRLWPDEYAVRKLRLQLEGAS